MPLEDKLGSGDVGEAGYPVPLGPYLLLHRLAKGGMGEVHLAKHGGLAGIEKYCVVKTLKRGALVDDESVRRFMDEARVVVNLTHRNICSVFDVGYADERYYLAMEHVAGRDLRAVMERAREMRVTVPAAVALHLVGEVLEALDYAHRFTHPTTGEPLHLVHRDVSPANVMVSVEGEVKLIDFGLALSRQKQQRTEPNMIMGKIAYMAPEQLAAERLDGRADLFAAGVMLYELLAGERFYGELSEGGIVLAAATGSYVPPKLQTLDEELREVLRSALQRSLALRTPDCAELAQQLTRYALRRQMSAGARELRELMETLFPDERARGRSLLARFGDVRGKTALVQGPPPAMPSALPPAPETLVQGELPADFETLASFDFETSDPSTPVGRVRLAKAKPDEVKQGTPRPALLERLGLPESCPAAAPPESARAEGLRPTGLDDGQGPGDVDAKAARVDEREAARAARPWLPVAAAALLISCVSLVIVATRAPEPPAQPAAADKPPVAEWIVEEPEPAAATVARPEQASITTASALPAAAVNVALPSVALPSVALPSVEPTIPVVEPSRKQRSARTLQSRRSKPRVLRAPGQAARPEQKIRYLRSSCRHKAPCAAELVSTFRAMRVDDARVFWAQVDACLSDCVQ